MQLRSAGPEVRLVNAVRQPFDGAVAAARTCYASRGIISAEEVGGDALTDPAERAAARARRDQLAQEIYLAGHHTVYQHAHFTFAIERISRHALWAFLHAHPFYNSEQVSQRYVKVRRSAALVPELEPRALAIYEKVLALQEQAYLRLRDMLAPAAASAFFAVFPGRGRRPEKWAREIRRKSQEAARYVLPVATWARLYHTVSALTLMRYRRCCDQIELPSELRLLIDAMLAELLRWDPSYELLIEDPLPVEETVEAQALAALGDDARHTRSAAFCAEFDAELGERVSSLVGYSPDAEQAVARAVREVLGCPRSMLPDEKAIALAADPARNAIYGEALNLTTHTKLTRTLHHAHYTFRRKISHTADSQDQRHRMTPASRPVLSAQLSDAPDVIRPSLISENPDARTYFDETMERIWEGITQLRTAGAPEEACAYLLPNAVCVRYSESGDYLALRHKHALRLCYNAQEEIWRASLDEAEQVAKIHPRLGAFLQPPCSLRARAGKKPPCPEGSRFCGVAVWKKPLGEFARRI